MANFDREPQRLQTRPFILEQDGRVLPSALIPRETQTQRDLREIGALQAQFDRALGRKHDAKDLLGRSYNPVIDRWWIERLRAENDKSGEDAYVEEIDRNLKTNLMERLGVGDNVIYYRIDGQNLYSQDFSQEPFSDVLSRGAEYRLQHGTREAEREGSEGEMGGFEIIRAKFTDPDTLVGTKMTSFSPEGRVEKSPYERNIVDEYELVEDLSGRFVKLTRRVVDFEEADYLSAALSLDPMYFDDYDGRPLDAWMLSHPVEGVIPNLEERQKGMQSGSFEKIYQTEMEQRIIDSYVEAVLEQNPDWEKIAINFNAIYNQMDKEEKAALGSTKKEQEVYLSQQSVQEAINLLGRMNPLERGGGGCPPSKGFQVSNGSNFLISGVSVSSFGAGAGGRSKEGFNCPKCGFNSQEPIGNQCPPIKGGCGITKEEFALKGGVVC